MIVELGHYALVLALFMALLQASLPLVGASRGQFALMALANHTALAQLILVALGFLALAHAYVTSDFSVLNVVENSHSAKPLLYKVTGVWGNHEGSMVLWVLILSLYGAAVALFGGSDGLGLVSRLVTDAPRRLRPGGLLIFEFGMGQDVEIEQLLDASPDLEREDVLRDLEGIARTAVARRR